MNQPSLARVATQVVGQYADLGRIVVGVYRDGAHRVVRGANARYADFLGQRQLPLVNHDVKASLMRVQREVAVLVEGGIDTGSQRAHQAIELISNGVKGGIERLASTAGRVEATAMGERAMSALQTLSLPVAKLSLDIATRAVRGTQRLADRVAPTKVARAKKTVARTAKRAAKAVSKRAGKAPVRRRVRAA